MFIQAPLHKMLKEIKAAHWLGKMTPFKIFGNTYYVGTYQSCCHMIDIGDGLILIDTGYAETAYLIVDSIYQLGFSPYDVKYIISTHWHGDHTAATAALAGLSGAKTVIGRDDAEKAKKYVEHDILVDDGDTLTLGNITINFMHTPGHTKGTMSMFYYDTDGVNTYRVGTFGGAGHNTLIPGKYDFEGAREAYFASIERLKKEHIDVFIANHCWNNDTWTKGKKLLETGENTFLHTNDVWLGFLEHYKRGLEDIIAQENAAQE